MYLVFLSVYCTPTPKSIFQPLKIALEKYFLNKCLDPVRDLCHSEERI